MDQEDSQEDLMSGSLVYSPHFAQGRRFSSSNLGSARPYDLHTDCDVSRTNSKIGASQTGAAESKQRPPRNTKSSTPQGGAALPA